MKPSSFLPAALLATAPVHIHAHSIFQRLSVNGADQGQLKGVRAPDSDYPIQNVNDGNFACNKGIHYNDNNVISIPAGAKVGAWWGHVIGGAQSANDPDNPIAKSHKGMNFRESGRLNIGLIMYYLAKVDNAATAGTTGLQWFKVAHEGLSGGKWAVDNMIAAGGWHYFAMPSCIVPGDYLLRVELIALHGAQNSGEAQFYMECAQIHVTGSGTSKGSNFVSFPGAYKANDPGIQVNIYDNSGSPYMGGRQYMIPGPAPLQCGIGGLGSGNIDTPVTSPPADGGNSGGTAPLYTQCGGANWSGPTVCPQGTCKVSNEWYSQCIP